jgi:short-subunit dehydrogenase
MHNIRTSLITGASSGIGAALAQALARPGATLHLSGRDETRLDAIAARCRDHGAAVECKVLDVCQVAGMADWIGAAGRLDLVIANAGISGRSPDGGPESAAQTRAIFEVNLGGVLNTVLPAMELMAMQPPGAHGIRGRIAVIASIAAFIAAPDSPAYCASKAAVDRWMVATAPAARRNGIVLTSVCPGFIRTAMTAGYQFAMPGLVDADHAARIILRGVAAGRIRVVFPWWMGLAARTAGLLPPRVMGALRQR